MKFSGNSLKNAGFALKYSPIGLFSATENCGMPVNEIIHSILITFRVKHSLSLACRLDPRHLPH